MTRRTVSHLLAELEARRDLGPAVLESAHTLRDQGWTYRDIGAAIYGPNARTGSHQARTLLTRHPERHREHTTPDPVRTITTYRLLTERADGTMRELYERGVPTHRIAVAAGYTANGVRTRVAKTHTRNPQLILPTR